MKFDELSIQEKAKLFKTLAQGGYLKGIPAGQIMSIIKDSYENLYKDGGRRRSILNKERIVDRVYGDGIRTSNPAAAVKQYLFGKKNSVDNRIKEASEYYSKYGDKIPKNNGIYIDENKISTAVDAAYLDFIKQHEDAKRIYFGADPKYGTMEKSPYRPTIGKPEENTYQINTLLNDEVFDNDILPRYSAWKTDSPYIIDSYGPDSTVINRGKNAQLLDFPYLSGATMSEGFDNNGQYISLYDKWDYNTKISGKSGDNIAKWTGGQPFDIYNRYYLDDWLDIPEENRGNPYIAPAVVTADAKAYGGNLYYEGGDEGDKNNYKLTLPSEFDKYYTGNKLFDTHTRKIFIQGPADVEMNHQEDSEFIDPTAIINLQEWYDTEGLRGRATSIPALEQLQDSLIARYTKNPDRYGLAQRLAILATSAEEMDKNGAASRGAGGNGYLGLSFDRMPESYLDDTPSGRGKQIHFLLEDLNTIHSDNWLNGGSGGPVIMSGKDGYDKFWNSNNVDEATKILNKSYIRPAGREDSWNNRANTANNMKKHITIFKK